MAEDGTMPMSYAELSEYAEELFKANKVLRGLLTEQRELIESMKHDMILLRHQAMFDELTELYRRAEFEKRAREALNNHAKIRRGYNVENQEIYLVLLDIRGFKQVNDDGGQKKGDIVLHNAAKAIKKRMSKTDLYCRFGGDEFGALLIGVSYTQIEQIVMSINQNLKEIDDRISFRFGHAKYVTGESYDELCQRADDALYDTKRREKSAKTQA